MNLIEALGKKSMLIDQLESEMGLLNPFTEETLAQVDRDIIENTDKLAEYFISLKKQLESKPKEIRAYAKFLQDKLEAKKESLEKYLTFTVRKHGQLRTDWSKISEHSRSLTRLVIDNFDLTAKTYPECLVVQTSSDNAERTIKINKQDLYNKDPIGFHIESYSTNFLMVKHLES